jgi:hypothetical protein
VTSCAVLWSSLALELLARAALSKFNPALLADVTSWHNLSYALGYTPKVAKFLPKSIGLADVLIRLDELLPDFDEELRKFCLIHAGGRNAELHSAEMAFEGASTSAWLPSFYRSCEVLGKSLGISLKDLFGDDEAKAAKKVMAAAKDAAANSVRGSINAHKTVWDGKPERERTKLASQPRSGRDGRTGMSSIVRPAPRKPFFTATRSRSQRRQLRVILSRRPRPACRQSFSV